MNYLAQYLWHSVNVNYHQYELLRHIIVIYPNVYPPLI